LAQHLTIERGATADYQVSDIMMMLVFGVLAGAKHMSHMTILRSDEVLRALFRWDKFPVSTTKSVLIFCANHASGVVFHKRNNESSMIFPVTP